MSCINATADGSRCYNNYRGGHFHGTSATVTLSLAPVVGAEQGSIMYTLDGSDPTSASAQKYGSEPLKLTDTTTLRAVVVRGEVKAAQQRNVTFLKVSG